MNLDKLKIKAKKGFDEKKHKLLSDPKNKSIAAKLYRRKLATEKAQNQ